MRCPQKSAMPIAVAGDDSGLSRDTKCLKGRTCTLVPPEGIQYKQEWKINEGKLELKGCGTVATIDSNYPASSGTEIHLGTNEESWSQEWTVITNDVILTTENGSPNQEWKAQVGHLLISRIFTSLSKMFCFDVFRKFTNCF